MKPVLIPLISLALIGCAAAPDPCYELGPAPTWKKEIMAGYSSTNRESSVRFAVLGVSQQILTDVSSQSIVRKNNGQTDFETTTEITSNLQFENLKTETARSGECYITWAGVDRHDADRILLRKLLSDRIESADWLRIRNSNNISLYREHVRKWPTGQYTPEALAKIRVIDQEEHSKLLMSLVVVIPLVMLGIQ